LRNPHVPLKHKSLVIKGLILPRIMYGTAKPVRDSEGVLRIEPDAIAAAWVYHYRVMHADKSGNSRNFNIWEAKLTRRNTPDAKSLDKDLRVEEIDAVLSDMKNWKAAGPDGIIPEVWKAAIEEELMTLLVLLPYA
ncbi:MAG: uncharacterized protein A8A55_3554, partial [Amphiamblys sp. WSBS2006]